MRPRRQKQCCLQLVMYLFIFIVFDFCGGGVMQQDWYLCTSLYSNYQQECWCIFKMSQDKPRFVGGVYCCRHQPAADHILNPFEIFGSMVPWFDGHLWLQRCAVSGLFSCCACFSLMSNPSFCFALMQDLCRNSSLSDACCLFKRPKR